MDERGWLTGTDPAPMLEFLRRSASDRKLRLFGCACCRAIWDCLYDEQGRKAVEVAERYADCSATFGEVAAAYCDALRLLQPLGRPHRPFAPPEMLDFAYVAVLRTCSTGMSFYGTAWECERYDALECAGEAADCAAQAAARASQSERSYDAMHKMQASLVRCLFGNPFHSLPPLAPTIQTFNDGVAVKLAARIYEARDFSAENLGVLADALEEAGVNDEAVLKHLRGPGPHARGCHAVDWALGKG